MTVTNENRSVTYDGDGSTTVFPVANDGVIYFLQASDLLVTLIDADGVDHVQALTTDYTVSGAGNADGGSVTMLTAPAVGERLRIERWVDILQPTNYPENTKFPAASHERALDRLTMIDQQQQGEIDRAPKFSETSGYKNVELPAPEDGKGIKWDEASGKYVNTEFDPDQAQADATAAKDAAEAARDGAIDAKNDAEASQVEAEAAAAAALAAVNAGFIFDAVADAQSANIPPILDFIRTAGYATAGDGGGALYKRAEVEPGHGMKIQSADGAWWEIAESVLHAKMAGAKIDGYTDDTEAYQRLFGACTELARDPDLGEGTAVISGLLELPLNRTIRGGNITLDFTGATLSIGMQAEGGDWADLPVLAASPSKGARTLTFSSAPDLVKGDIIGLRDPRDGSFNTVDVINRPYYRAGEYCVVKEVSGATVYLWEPLISGYDHTIITVHKFSNDTIKFDIGNLTLLGGDNVGNPIKFSRLRDATHDNMTVIGGSLYGIYRTQCYNIRGDNVHVKQDILSGQGVDYGLIDGSCQKTYATGSFFGKRHGYAAGNGGGLTLPCRFMNIRGIFANDQTTSLGSCNTHGNCEFYNLEGEFHGGGVQFGGDHGRARGNIFVADGNEVAIAGTECLGTSFDASGMRIFAPNSVTTNGVIRWLATAIGEHTVRSGRINLTNIEITAPVSERLVGITSGGGRTGTESVIDMRGMAIHAAAVGGVQGILVNNSTGDGITKVYRSGIVDNAGISYSIANNIRSMDVPVTAQITIESGSITLVGPEVHHVEIDTEGAASSDDLVTINGGTHGQIIILTSASNTRDPTIKHGTGNIVLNGSVDFTLNSRNDSLMLMYNALLSSPLWVEVGRGDNG